MNEQIIIRLTEKMITTCESYIQKHGFSSIQELIKELLREKLFEEQTISKKELALVKKLISISDKSNLYGTEEELFKKLK